MSNSYLFLFLSLPLLLLCSSTSVSSSSSDHSPKSYIVYLGGSITGGGDDGGGGGDINAAEEAHLQMLSQAIPREGERIEVGHVYKHAIRGFSAMLSPAEASLLSGHEEVISVFADPKLKLHTTRSWEFLEAESGATSSDYSRFQHVSSDVIIGIIDTGIWPESASFSDKGIGEIPRKWKGVCMEGHDFKKSNCNRKLIGARYYNTLGSTLSRNTTNSARSSTATPRDHDSHGTHTTSIAAGATVANASYYGLARGTARGGSPTARIAVYKACTLDNCDGSTILKAIDDAVSDGVDIISISLGMDLSLQSSYLDDPIAIGSFHASQMGVMVVGSGGNNGPAPYSLVNTAPWIFTVAASNIDRDFESTISLGNGVSFKGSGINVCNLTRSSKYPLAFAGDVGGQFTPPSEASNCYPGSLDPKKVAGKIIVCVDSYPSIARRIKKLVVQDAGARGLIYVSELEKNVPFDSGAFPFAHVGENEGLQILMYINSTRRPTATILPTYAVEGFKPAPVVADFSSRGPAELTENILKPDIMAPGVAILAANIPESEAGQYYPIGKKPSKFAIKSGTSMACPHVTGASAFVKSVHREWTPSMIKSALMTTATTANNMGKAMTNSTGNTASPHDTGVGELSPHKAVDPGLVFATTTQDYLHFLCYLGYREKNIRSMSKTAFKCPKDSSDSLITDINYPTISIGRLRRDQARKVTRQVMNVGSKNATYFATVHAPQGLRVKVSPNKIIFQEGIKTASFSVLFYGKQALKGYNYGSVNWFDGLHNVHVVFAVNIV